MKVHKRVENKIYVAFDNKAKCGFIPDYLSDLHLAWRWDKVTCKNCLIHKPHKRSKKDEKK